MGSLQQKDAAWNGERRPPIATTSQPDPDGTAGPPHNRRPRPRAGPEQPHQHPQAPICLGCTHPPAPLSPQPRSRLLTASPQPGRAQQRRPQPQQRHAAPLRRHAAPPALTAQARRAACRER